MDWSIIPLRFALVFVVVLARIGGMVTFAPFWSHKSATNQVRVLLALAMACVITPVVMNRIPVPPTNTIALTLIIFGELLIGCAVGYVGRLMFSALELAAKVFGDVIGFSLAATIDPSTRAQTAALGIIAQMTGMMVLLGMDGHHWLLSAIVRSFDISAPGNVTLNLTLLEVLIRLSADVLAMGLGLAAPAVVVLLGVEVFLAIAGRAAPQLQIMVLGFPLKIAAGLWLLGSTIYFIPGAIRTVLSTMRVALTRTIAAF